MLTGASSLTLHSTRTVAAHQVFYFRDGHAVEISLDGVLQATGRNGKLEGFLPVFIGM